MFESHKRQFSAEDLAGFLNDRPFQKKLGAFYTPPLYAQKALELVREAIREVPQGNDYVIEGTVKDVLCQIHRSKMF